MAKGYGSPKPKGTGVPKVGAKVSNKGISPGQINHMKQTC